MGKKKSLSKVQRAQIVALHGQNLSERQISAQMWCSKTAMPQAIAKYQQDGSYIDKKRTGRPRVITAREDNVMKRIVVRSPTSSMKKIRAELFRRGRRISHMTVSRRLSEEFNLKSYKPTKKPKLTAAMKASVYNLLIIINIGPPSNEKKCFFPTNQPSNRLWFERGTSVDLLENVLMRDTPYQQ